MVGTLPPGVKGVHVLPADHHNGPWDHIVVPPRTKERLLNHAVLRLRHGRALSALPGLPHGLIILSGPPGTGKSTLAQGLAQTVARELAPDGSTTLLEVDPHAFPSEMLGDSQRNVVRFMTETIPEFAARRPHTVVLVDEVESLAVSRSQASFETNPVDVHRATDALLAGMDEIAKEQPRVLFVCTTNFAGSIDEAFLSRADYVLSIGLPSQVAVVTILQNSLRELAQIWPQTMPLASDDELLARLAKHCEGWDGRKIRKLVLRALAESDAAARDPSRLTAEDLVSVAEAGNGRLDERLHRILDF
jgi:AAA+ superfamily predicted ATPase